MILYRPVGLQELALIYDSGMKTFPARLPQQPIFYPVLDLEYARQTASDWNTKNGQFAGYVTQFKVEDEYISQFEEHAVGKSQYQELWIPADEVEEFNRHIVGHIKVVETHFGAGFEGFVPEQFGLQAKNAVEQFTLLANSYLYKRMEFYLEIKRNHKAIFLNYPFWQTHAFKNPGLKERILQAIKEAWLTSFPQIPLPLPPPIPGETPPVTQAPAYGQAKFSMEPDQEEIALGEQTASYSWDNPVEEDIPPEKQANSHPWIQPVHEEMTPARQTNSGAWVDPIEEDIPPAEQSDSSLLVNPVPEETTLPEQRAPYFEQGIQLGLSGKVQEAIAALFQAVEKEPDDVVAHTSLGVAFHRVGEDDRALACYEAALKINPQYAEAHYFRANILYSQGQVREAITAYTLAIGLQPELIGAHEAPEPQDRLTDFGPTPAQMYRIARPAQRILELNQALEINPQQADLFKERAAQYSRLWNNEQAVSDYSSSLALRPNDASALHSRGVAYEQLGQHDRALKDFQQALALQPQLSDVHINRGIELGQLGNFRQSVVSFTEGIRLAPHNPDGYFNRGVMYVQQGDFENAIADFSMVIQLSPNDGDAYYWRGVSHETVGRQREASADYRQFLALSQDRKARIEIEQKLSQWAEGERNGLRNQTIVPDEGQKTDQVQAEERDLYDLLVALGERALHSTWFGSDVDCYGEKAEELHALTVQSRSTDGHDLLRIAAGIQQTLKGDFQAFDPGAESPWIFLRAWEGSGFYLETNDSRITRQLKSRFREVEEVDGASAPYEGLFIHI